MRAPPDSEVARLLLRQRGRPPWYKRWWVWTLAVTLFAVLLLLFGQRTRDTSREDDGILYRLFQRAGGGRAPKPQ